MRDDCAETLDNRDSASRACGEGGAPARPLGNSFKHRALARSGRQLIAAIFEWILARGGRKLIDEAFVEKAMLACVDRAPVGVDLVRDILVVTDVDGGDRIRDARFLAAIVLLRIVAGPRRDLAVAAQCRLQPRGDLRAIRALRHILFTAPDQLDRIRDLHRDHGDLFDDLAIGREASPESAAHDHWVKHDLADVETRCLGEHRPCAKRILQSTPYVEPTVLGMRDERKRLHHRLMQERRAIVGGHKFPTGRCGKCLAFSVELGLRIINRLRR